eukprot:TRINITY_DN6128_c0_g1_i12.p1 TRINITY_DN6128_c0_g1~~TRINITY_DN6128_c0_g1_i12.p1  ORF type:complete len:234 (+),score=40.54 TRINITY_DN6128_c0_g1_i12:182-883(+)
MCIRDSLRALWTPPQPIMASSLSPCNTAAILSLLGHPERGIGWVQVAGTNGKGSVVHKVAEGLSSSGHKVGVFTSPHICTFRERIQVNQELIPVERVTNLYTEIRAVARDCGLTLSRFEMLTLMAIKHFQQSGVEYGVLEAGLGGRIDATSAIEHKLVSIVSSVALDHTHILGHTIPQIAAEKAGVFKGAECGVVGSSMHADAQAVLHQVAADLVFNVQWTHSMIRVACRVLG